MTTSRREYLQRFDLLLTAAIALDESTEAPDAQSGHDAIRVARATLTWIAQSLDRDLHADVAAVVVAHLRNSPPLQPRKGEPRVPEAVTPDS